MDPYLENRYKWPGFHHAFVIHLSAALNARLPRRYVARVGERVYIVQEQRPILPDVALIEKVPPREADSGGGIAVAVAAEQEDASVIVDVEEVTVRELFIEIRHVGSAADVITVVEVLSPTNKSSGDDREPYVQKQAALLASPTNLLEIDLLRKGRHTVAVPLGSLPTDVPWHYLVSLHRSAQRGRYQVWRVTLQQRLPRILVPLADGDPDIRVDLEAVFTRAYDEGAYDRDIDYAREPDPPLAPADAAWADSLLRERGLRR
jgi:hypothetical protein